MENTRKDLLLKEEELADLANGSEELMLDLKSELDTTREQIARMKRAGMGDSIETEKAVSQLQEALGTIRVLQESLRIGESPFGGGFLKADLADAMESQMAEIQRADDEKKQLRQKTKDLESEIAMLREDREGTGVGFQKLNAELREQLEAPKLKLPNLKKERPRPRIRELPPWLKSRKSLLRRKTEIKSCRQPLPMDLRARPRRSSCWKRI